MITETVMRRMLKWFHGLFHLDVMTKFMPRGSQRQAVVVQSAVPLAEEQSVADHAFRGNYQDLPAWVDEHYFAWVTGAAPEGALPDDAFASQMLDYLDVLASSELAGSNLIPRVPSVMIQLLKRMHEENVSSLELSRLISKDVVLVAAILGEVNSSFYNLSERSSDLSQAILMLGHNRLRMVLAKVSFTPVYSQQLGSLTRESATRIWDESQRRALACYRLAKARQVDPFMAFLAGLMQDVGLMVALRVFDRSSAQSQLPSLNSFRSELESKALLLSSRIGTIWALPGVVIKAIEAQASPTQVSAVLPLAQVLRRADFLSKTSILIQQGLLSVDMDRMRKMLTEAEMNCFFVLLDGKSSLAQLT